MLLRAETSVEIDLQEQRAYLLQNGRPVLASPISSGRYGHLTEGGSFKVLEKERNHYSSIYGKIVDASGTDRCRRRGCRHESAERRQDLFQRRCLILCGSMAPTECMPDIYQAIPLRTAVFACQTNMHCVFQRREVGTPVTVFGRTPVNRYYSGQTQPGFQRRPRFGPFMGPRFPPPPPPMWWR